MAEKIDAPFVEGLQIGDGWQVVWAAIDPNTGAAIPNVVVSNANVVAADVSAAPISEDTVGPFMLVPGPGA